MEQRTHRGYLVAALGLVVASVVAVVIASRTDPSRLGIGPVDPDRLPVGAAAPSLRNAGEWINSPPLTSSDLAGKVVVYDFWTYSCVNCVRTLPFLRSWYDRYAADGLVIVGVHTPEFDFERRRANVEAASLRLGVTWPVAMDNARAVWDDFANRYWPSKYVADRDGRVRYTHIGEGAYDETEAVLRSLLGVAKDAARAAAPGVRVAEPGAAARESISPETYLGVLRSFGRTHRGVDTYPEPPPLVVGEHRLIGTWEGTDDSSRSVSESATIVLRYRAREVNLVMAASPAVDVVVEVDGRPVAAELRAADVKAEPSGATVVRVDHDDMYRLVLGPRVEEHTLRLTVRGTGLAAYAFTFGA